jgi:energy-coupling factor transporter ATP-binding protein EcfA2
MKIKRLKTKNLKGRTLDIEPGDLNVIVGDNWSGKTTVLTAVRIGLLGYDPAVGKRETFANAAGSDMAVTLLLDEPNYIERRWRTVRGSVKAETTQPADWPGVPSLLLDVNDYFGMSGQQRRDYVLSQIDVGDASSDAAMVAKIKGIKIEGHSAAHESEIDDLVDEFHFWAGERDEHKTPASEWMKGMVDRLKDEKIRHRKEEIEKATALVKQIADERAANPAGVPADQTGDLLILRGERDELNKQLGAATSARDTFERNARARQRLAELDLDGLKARKVVAFKKWEKLNDKLHGIGAKSSASLQPKIDVLRSRKAVAEADHKSNHAQQADLLKQVETAKAAKCCPTCGSESDYQKYKAKIVAGIEEQIQKTKAEAATLLRRGVEIQTELDEMDDKEKARLKAEQAAISLKSEVAQAWAEHQSVEASLAEAENLKALVGPDAEISGPSVEQLKLAVGNHDTAIFNAEAKQKRRLLLIERQAQEALAVKQRDDNEARLAVDKEWLKLLVETQTELIDGAFGPFVQKVRQFTDGVLDFELRYKDGDIGYVRDGQWVGHATFSGAERALVYAGLGVALAQRSPVKVVLMDELILSAANKRKVADRMFKLIADGVIDQFFVCDVSASEWGDGVNVVRVSRS